MALSGGVALRRRTVLIIFAVIVLVAVVALVVSRRSGPAGSGVRPDQATPGPILLVPGYGGSRVALTELAGHLTGRGRTATVLTLAGDGTGDLIAQVGVLDAAVRAALAGGAPSVDIVGYSAGGVVTRLWVDRHDGAAVARRIVSLGSPLHGTRIAGLGAQFAPGSCPQACRQLAPGSDVLDEIDGADLPDGLPWLSIWTTADETVQPPDSSRLDGAVNLPLQDICGGSRVSHSGLPTDPAITALVERALGTDPLTVPKSCPVS